MTLANMIPKYRVVARHRARLLRRWAFGLGAMLLIIGTCGMVMYSDQPADRLALQREIQQYEQRAAAAKARISEVQPQLTRLRQLYEAEQNMQYQPDWSILLLLLDNMIDEDQVVLRQCRIEPMGSRAQPAGPRQGGMAVQQLNVGAVGDGGAMYVLRLGGVARVQSEVSRLLLNLEQTGLFSSVRLHNMRQEPLRDIHVHAFQIDCLIGTETDKP